MSADTIRIGPELDVGRYRAISSQSDILYFYNSSSLYLRVTCKELLAININIIYVLPLGKGEKTGWLIFCLIIVSFLFHEEHILIKITYTS
ncbi:hypothetical protein DWG24_02120 [Dickeya zeae]|uniref:Uncharacterized protein n=1 Tax=Dickeya zeae TaxID=204042 RepID=A0AAE6YWL9_9GAMM|nr:hypothetical protein DWG24_02120 [Dickeya zeae]